MTIRKKEDVQITYHNGVGDRSPMVNVKVYGSVSSVPLPLELDASFPAGRPDLLTTHYSDPGFTHEWIEENVSDDEMSEWFYFACESGFEWLQDEASRIFDNYNVTVYSAGRSGGWAVVEGLPEIEEWDAIMLSKWKRFANVAEEVTDDIPRSIVGLIYSNVYERALDEAENAREAAVMEIATVGA